MSLGVWSGLLFEDKKEEEMMSAPSKVMIREANSQLVMMHQKISDLESNLAESREELSTVQEELDKTRAMVKCQEHIAQEKEATGQKKESLQHTQLVQYQEQCQKQLDAMKHHCKTQLTDLTSLYATSQSSLAETQTSLAETQTSLAETQSELHRTQSDLSTSQREMQRVMRRSEEAESKASKLDVLLASESTLRSLLAVIELINPTVEEVVEKVSEESLTETVVAEECETSPEALEQEVAQTEAALTEVEVSTEVADAVEVADIEVAVTEASQAVKEIEALEADVTVEEQSEVTESEVTAEAEGTEVIAEESEVVQPVQDEVVEVVEEPALEPVEPKDQFYESKDEIETDRATIDTNSTFGELLDLTQEPEWGTQDPTNINETNSPAEQHNNPDDNSREPSGESGGSTEGWEKDSMSFPESTTTDSSYLNLEQPEIQSVDEDQCLDGEEEEEDAEGITPLTDQNMNTVFNINVSAATPSLIKQNISVSSEVTESQLYSETNSNESVV